MLHNSSRLAKFCFFFPITTFYIILNYAFRTHVPSVYTWLREHLFEHACVKKLLFIWKCVRYVTSSVHLWIVGGLGGGRGCNSAPCDDTAVVWFSNRYFSSFLSFSLVFWIFWFLSSRIGIRQRKFFDRPELVNIYNIVAISTTLENLWVISLNYIIQELCWIKSEYFYNFFDVQ